MIFYKDICGGKERKETENLTEKTEENPYLNAKIGVYIFKR